MRWVFQALVVALLAAPSPAAASYASLAAEYTFARNLTSQVSLFWTLNETESVISMAFRGPVENSAFVSVAWASTSLMIPATAFIAFPALSPLPATLREYDLVYSQSSRFAQAVPDVLTSTSVSTSLGFLEARFRRPFNASNYNFNPSAQIYVLWALGSSSTLEGHRDRGYVAPFDWRNPHVCSPDCGARGSCQAGNVCLCRDGYTGPVCSVAPRASVDAALDASYRFKAVLSTSPEVAVWWNTTEDALVMTVRAATAGYVAVGFSDSGGMVNSNAVIGFVANNVATVTEYALTARSDSGVAPVPVSELRNVSGSEQGGVTTIAFTRPLSSNGRTISLAGEQRIVWAVGNGDVVNRHVERGRASCNLLTGACTGSTNQLREAHGWLMALSMGVLLPLGVLFPRFLKQRDPLWFNLHRGVQTLALVLAWIGFFVIVGYMADVNGEHLANNHARFGLAILLLATLQFVGGVLRAKKGAPRRAAWEAAHHWMGRVTMVVALIGPFTGLRQLDPASLYWALYVLWFAFYVALSVFLEVRARMTARGPEQLPEVEGTATQDAKREASGSLTQQ